MPEHPNPISQPDSLPAEFRDWPAGSSPLEIGKRVAENFAARPFGHPGEYVYYPEVCAWHGALTFAERAGDGTLREKLIRKFDPLLTPEWAPALKPQAHVDYRVFGAIPLEIFRQTRNPMCLEIGRRIADAQWAESTPDGISADARYWIDDMYMITLLQAQAGRATGDAKYADRAALAMEAYLDRLQQPNGLFFHAPGARFYWSRGNGWMAAGAAELLSALPVDHPRRARILEGYRRMLRTLLGLQGEDGLWRQLLDVPEAWPETSGTGMFAFAMIAGVRRGWLDDPAYAAAARNAWRGLVQYIDESGDVREVCAGTPKGDTAEYYLARPRVAGDLHGQAPVLWCASELLE
jgi:rhamnogalacturonyl hydrolase YesR